MFITRFTDIADYQQGYYINVFGIFKLLKYKVSKIMEKDDYIVIIAICGYEYVIQ
jgi:hypothetical protein